MNAFKLARLEAGLTQLAVARACGVSESKICRIETGRFRPSPGLRRRLAALLNRSEDRLFVEPGTGAAHGHTN